MRYFPLLILIFITSCAWLIPTAKKAPTAKNIQYKLNYKVSGWTELAQKQSDYVYQNTNGTTLVVNTFCGEFQDDPLSFLAEKAFVGLDEVSNKKGSPLTISNREAYKLEGTGKLDGVKVNIKVINLRRNNCYYDFLRITPVGQNILQNQPEDLIGKVEFLP